MARMDPQEILQGIMEVLPSAALRKFDPSRIVEACPGCDCPLSYYGVSGPYQIFVCPKCATPYLGTPGKLRSCVKAPPPPPSAETLAAQARAAAQRASEGRCDHDWEYRGPQPYKCRRCGLLFGTGDSAEQLEREQARQRTEQPVIPETAGVDDTPDPGGRRFCPHCGNAPDQGHLPQCPAFEGDPFDPHLTAAEELTEGQAVGINDDGEAVSLARDDEDEHDEPGDDCPHLVYIRLNQHVEKCRDCGIRRPVSAGNEVAGG